MIALMDCNNFYVSCERVFNPALLQQPVIILSNNDGCVVSRSNEAKAIGIKMSEPAFFITDFLKKHKVVSLSSNYVLYGDMSQRVFDTVKQLVPKVEIYSIDEMFLDLTGTGLPPEAMADRIAHTVTRHTGIPVSIGIGPTKTLAKVANYWAKKNNTHCILTTPHEIKQTLQETPLEEVWGIGEQTARFLFRHKLTNAWQLRCLYDNFVRKTFNVTTLRIVKELRGTPCIPVTETPAPQKNICIGRSFGSMTSDFEILREAVANFASQCAEKLRNKSLATNLVTVFLETNPFRADLAQYNTATNLPLEEATDYTPKLISTALTGLIKIYREGFMYKKAGVLVSCLEPSGTRQQHLFEPSNHIKNTSLMQTVDSVNTIHGRNSVRIATQGFERKWWLRQEKLSNRFTTQWNELAIVNS